MSAFILTTRPAEDGDDYAGQLQAEGFQTLSAPMLEIKTKEFDVPDLSKYQGLLFTSANALRVFAGATPRRDIAVYAVGGHTAEAAESAGFTPVYSADGNAEDLARFVTEKAGNADKPFLHVRGEHISRPLHVLLGAQGFKVDLLPVYTAQMAEGFSPETLDSLKTGRIQAVTFFSRRTAVNFLDLVEQQGLSAELKSIKALCISDEVLKCVQPYSWAGTFVSEAPDRASMLKLLKSVCV